MNVTGDGRRRAERAGIVAAIAVGSCVALVLAPAGCRKSEDRPPLDPPPPGAAESLQEVMEGFMRAWVEGKVRVMVSMLHPRIVRDAGGEAAMVAMMRTALGELATKAKLDPARVELSPASRIVCRDGTCLGYVGHSVPFEVGGETKVLHSGTIGVSNDGGKKWMLVSTEGATPGFFTGDERRLYDELSPPEPRVEDPPAGGGS